MLSYKLVFSNQKKKSRKSFTVDRFPRRNSGPHKADYLHLVKIRAPKFRDFSTADYKMNIAMIFKEVVTRVKIIILKFHSKNPNYSLPSKSRSPSIIKPKCFAFSQDLIYQMRITNSLNLL